MMPKKSRIKLSKQTGKTGSESKGMMLQVIILLVVNGWCPR
jgi:hypothetical protein